PANDVFINALEERYRSVRRFLPDLLERLHFGANPTGKAEVDLFPTVRAVCEVDLFPIVRAVREVDLFPTLPAAREVDLFPIVRAVREVDLFPIVRSVH
ncbi:hypothetical protein, partial [Klebsiella pneumoniae]|uniref:hypothetical protein n=1 Tax=Klebsiella pneumoniae TaxID=573 RepID=UPI0037450359